MLSTSLFRLTGLAAAVGFLSTPAVAEVLPVAGIYPAGSDAALDVEIIAVEAFTGDHGPSLQFMIKDKLEDVRINGDPWFLLVPTVGDDIQAVIRGSASHESIEERIESKSKTECLEKDKDKKCIARRTRSIPCYRLTVHLFPDVRMTAVDGRELYSYSSSQEIEREYCEDDSKKPSVSGMLTPLRHRVGYHMRNTLAPVQRNQEFRILESRKGMSRDDRRAFKSAVRLTKTDTIAACQGFEALEASNSAHPSVLFNIGLCAESRNDRETARDYYQRTLAVKPGEDYSEQGLSRLDARDRADRQLAIRFDAASEEGSTVD